MEIILNFDSVISRVIKFYLGKFQHRSGVLDTESRVHDSSLVLVFPILNDIATWIKPRDARWRMGGDLHNPLDSFIFARSFVQCIESILLSELNTGFFGAFQNKQELLFSQKCWVRTLLGKLEIYGKMVYGQPL